MITAKNRFRGRRDPRIVLKHGKTIRNDNLQLRYLAKKTGRGYRAAVIVSKKVSKKAPTRNRIRRRVYEAIRTSTPPVGFDFIILVHDESVADMKFSELQESIDRLLSQIK